MSKTIIANFKMELSLKQSLDLLKKYKKGLKTINTNYNLIVCPDFLCLAYLSAKDEKTRVFPFNLGSQTVGHLKYGALTGEVSAFNLKDIGVSFCLLGHSERRQMGENNHIIREKIKTALKAKLIPVLCIGEEKKLSKSKLDTFLAKEIRETFSGFSQSEMKKIIIAYEPVWAIGNKNPCLPKKADEVHGLIKEIIFKKFKTNIKVLYGGSVNGENAKSYLEWENIDGLLVGGASLSWKKFKKVIN